MLLALAHILALDEQGHVWSYGDDRMWHKLGDRRKIDADIEKLDQSAEES